MPCRGPSRREILRVGTLSFLGLGLGDLLRLRAQAGEGGAAPPKAKNCILIWLAGGPSHLDTFDPKPGASADVRGEFKPIATSVPGVSISEVFPNLAKVMNKVTLIRSMTSPESDHDRAHHDRLSPIASPDLSGIRQRSGQNTRVGSRHASSVCRRTRRADFRIERVPHPRLRSVFGFERPQLGGVPRSEPDHRPDKVTLERLLRQPATW